MYKAINNIREQKGFTLIELLIVVAIIGILAAVAIPGYIGMQERGRKGAVTRVASANEPELQGWMNSIKKSGTLQGGLVEVDTDGSGQVVSGTDMTNNELALATLGDQWLIAHPNPPNASPWSSPDPLWAQGAWAAATTMDTCTAAALNGRITICGTPAGDATITTLFIVAKDKGTAIGGTDGGLLVQKTISSD